MDKNVAALAELTAADVEEVEVDGVVFSIVSPPPLVVLEILEAGSVADESGDIKAKAVAAINGAIDLLAASVPGIDREQAERIYTMTGESKSPLLRRCMERAGIAFDGGEGADSTEGES